MPPPDPKRDPGLRAGSIGLPGLISESVAATAPVASAVTLSAVVAGLVGRSTPFAFLAAGAGVFALALVYARLARGMQRAGGTIAIIERSFGPEAALLTGLVLLGVSIVCVPGFVIIVAQFVLGMIPGAVVGGNAPGWAWLAIGLGSTGIVVVLSALGVTSIRVLVFITAAGLLLLLVFDLAILASRDAPVAWATLLPSRSMSPGLLVAATGVALTGSGGFEAAVFLSEEARSAARSVPRAVVISAALAWGIYVLTTLAITTAIGADATAQWVQDAPALLTAVGARHVAPGFAFLLLLSVATSSLAAALACANGASRFLYDLGRSGALPRFLGRTHPRWRAPWSALGILALCWLSALVAGRLLTGPSMADLADCFGWLMIAATAGLLPTYGLVAWAGLRGAPAPMDRIPALLALAFLAAALVSLFYPAPPPTLRSAPYAMLAWSVGWFLLRRIVRARP